MNTTTWTDVVAPINLSSWYIRCDTDAFVVRSDKTDPNTEDNYIKQVAYGFAGTPAKKNAVLCSVKSATIDGAVLILTVP